MNHFLPYKIDAESEELFYYGLEKFSEEVFEKGKTDLKQIIDNIKDFNPISDNESKSVILELLLIGVLWKCHINDAVATDKSELAELNYSEKLIKNSSSSDIFRKIFYRMRADVLLHHDNFSQFENDEKSLRKLINWLEVTGEYTYEIRVFENWFSYWHKQKFYTISAELTQILNFTNAFIKIGDNMMGSFLNPLFFNVFLKTIATNREDYFQIAKPEPEYLLNLIAAEWLNEINDEKFQSFDSKKIMVPGCMRPDNGKSCKAVADGAYLKCINCNNSCNINKLVKEANKQDFDVRIALHQSTFKAETRQLKNSAFVGVACAGCLISGGLMLEQKGIQAKCLILNKPGCNGHWSDTGEQTNISFSQIEKLLPGHAPNNCIASDSKMMSFKSRNKISIIARATVRA
jgi:hypothetical protein